jgi:hypothetical protein
MQLLSVVQAELCGGTIPAAEDFVSLIQAYCCGNATHRQISTLRRSFRGANPD